MRYPAARSFSGARRAVRPIRVQPFPCLRIGATRGIDGIDGTETTATPLRLFGHYDVRACVHSTGSKLRISQAGDRTLEIARRVASEPARWQHLMAKTVSYDASSHDPSAARSLTTPVPRGTYALEWLDFVACVPLCPCWESNAGNRGAGCQRTCALGILTYLLVASKRH